MNTVWNLFRLTEAVIDLCKRLDEIDKRLSDVHKNVARQSALLDQIGAFAAADVVEAEILDADEVRTTVARKERR